MKKLLLLFHFDSIGFTFLCLSDLFFAAADVDFCWDKTQGEGKSFRKVSLRNSERTMLV